MGGYLGKQLLGYSARRYPPYEFTNYTTYIKYTYHICAKITWCFVKSLFPQKWNNSCLHGAPLLTAFISKALSKRMFSLQQDHFSAKVSSAHSCCLFLFCFSWSRKSCKVVNAAVKWSSNMMQNANAKQILNAKLCHEYPPEPKWYERNDIICKPHMNKYMKR